MFVSLLLFLGVAGAAMQLTTQFNGASILYINHFDALDDEQMSNCDVSNFDLIDFMFQR